MKNPHSHSNPGQGTQFAVTWAHGNERELIKLFGEAGKEEALAFARVYSRSHPGQFISCIRTLVDSENRLAGNSYALYGAWIRNPDDGKGSYAVAYRRDFKDELPAIRKRFATLEAAWAMEDELCREQYDRVASFRLPEGQETEITWDYVYANKV